MVCRVHIHGNPPQNDALIQCSGRGVNRLFFKITTASRGIFRRDLHQDLVNVFAIPQPSNRHPYMYRTQIKLDLSPEPPG